jgi:oligopeptide/dipeptide ABC transporter ATP-binding protein
LFRAIARLDLAGGAAENGAVAVSELEDTATRRAAAARVGALLDTVGLSPDYTLDPPAGCRFQTRCPRAKARCRAGEPPITEDRPDHWGRCYFPEPEPLRRPA